MKHADLFQRLKLSVTEPNLGVYSGKWCGAGKTVEVFNPSDGSLLAQVVEASRDDTIQAVRATREAFIQWRKVPGPKRGEVLRLIRNAIEDKLVDLGALVTLEMGKIASEGRGEIQEFLDVADYAIGLGRTFGGGVTPSERSHHFMAEIPNPLGVLGLITAFNFPVAVYGWNFSLAMVCGNATIWKPAPTTPLCAIAVTKIIIKTLEDLGLPGAISSLACGGGDAGWTIVNHADVDLISFTGSEQRGKQVGVQAALGFKQSILELGGNNAVIVMPDADLSLALHNVLFAALGTAGQRCTTARRLFVHSSIADHFFESLSKGYASATKRIGRPEDEGTLIGPLHSKDSVQRFLDTIDRSKEEGGELRFGGTVCTPHPSLQQGNWVTPTLIVYRDFNNVKIVKEETFAPILHATTFDTLEQAICLNNAVSQGLSSSLFTKDISNVFQWMGPEGSDCGIVNINGSTSGAEVGARFGGNKSTGWGRECGGDAWKQYCRWSTCTLNWFNVPSFAQGVTFE